MLKIFAGGILGAFAGQNIEFDKNDFTLDLIIEKNLLGFIPYSVEKKMTGGNISEIQNMFGTSDTGQWDCGYSTRLKQMAQSHGNRWKRKMHCLL